MMRGLWFGVWVNQLGLRVSSREKPIRLRHVLAIFISEEFAHHHFLAWRPDKIQRCECHQRRQAGKPVLQQQRLCDAEKPDGRIHRVPDGTVNSMSYKLMALAYFERDGPVLAQIPMRAPEEPKRNHHGDEAAPQREDRKRIIRKSEQGSGQIKDREQKSSCDNDEQ